MRQLGSGDESQLRTGVALPPEQPLDRDTVTQLQELGGLSIDSSPFQVDGDRT